MLCRTKFYIAWLFSVITIVATFRKEHDNDMQMANDKWALQKVYKMDMENINIFMRKGMENSLETIVKAIKKLVAIVFLNLIIIPSHFQ